MTITEWVRRAQEGDDEAFAEICRQFAGLVKKQARQPHLRTLGEDAEGEGWLALADAVKSYDPHSGVRFAGYAESRVRFALWNLFKRERRRWQRELPASACANEEADGDWLEAVPDAGDVQSEALLNLETAWVRQEIAALPCRQRYVVEATCVHGATLAETAAVLGISVQAVSNMKQRALKRVRSAAAGMYLSEGR